MMIRTPAEKLLLHCFLVLGAWVGYAAHASADLIEITASVGGNARDGSEPPGSTLRDGSFDALVSQPADDQPAQLRAGVHNDPAPSAQTEYRFAVEFDLSKIRSNRVITDADLLIDFLSTDFAAGTGFSALELSVFGYGSPPADGDIQLADFESNTVATDNASTTFTYTSSTPVSNDINASVTQFVQTQFGAGSDFIGFTIGFTDANYPTSAGEAFANFAGFNGSGTAPTLAVQVSSVPEPSSLALLSCGVVGSYFCRRYRRRKTSAA